nr:CYTH domain-containing protein [uncultured Niameybacter sp.]
MEIERKFLVKELPDLKAYPHKKIKQGYISTDPVIRIRQMNNTYCVCLKSQGHMIREEFELGITKEQCDALWHKVDNHPVEKIRYFIPLENDLTAELDIYEQYLEGLLTVEVEFPSPQDAANFIPPDWFGEDITHDNRYKNNHLSVYGIPR